MKKLVLLLVLFISCTARAGIVRDVLLPNGLGRTCPCVFSATCANVLRMPIFNRLGKWFGHDYGGRAGFKAYWLSEEDMLKIEKLVKSCFMRYKRQGSIQ